MGVQYDDDLTCPTLSTEIHARLEQHKIGLITQTQVDQLIVPCILALNKDPLLQRLGWQYLTPTIDQTFQIHHLCDIGSHIRAMLMYPTTTNRLANLLRLSMPYIKHNRLSFFPFEQANVDTLQNLLRLQLATCIGIYSENSKKPLWSVRVRLVAMFMNLLANGSPMDMYIFCSTHICLVRLALIEYYVYFVENFMPVEYNLQHLSFGTEVPFQTIVRQLRCIADSFRQHQFQVDMQWDLVQVRSQSAVEKCNRCAKGIIRMNHETPSLSIKYNDVAVAMNAPMSSLLHFQHPNAAIIKKVHSLIRTYPMPLRMTTQQSRAIRDRMKQDTFLAVNACYLHFCLICSTVKIPDKSLRCGVDGKIVCGNCLDNSSIINVNIFGRFVQIIDKYYFLCPFCTRVHQWRASGCEFSKCENTAATVGFKKKCLICTSSVSINQIQVLDAAIGVIQTVMLCNRHTPYEHQQVYMHDLNCMMNLIQAKYKRR